MLKRVYWCNTKIPNTITAKVGYRADNNAPYEIYIEKWENESGGWVYKGSQAPERQHQLKNHPDLRLQLNAWLV